MKQLSIGEWKAIPENDKDVLTAEQIAYQNEPDYHVGRHIYTQREPDRCQVLTEKTDFEITPTWNELNDITKQLLNGIDAEKAKGYHSQSFTSSVPIDDQTLIIASTREHSTKSFQISLMTYEKSKPRWKKEIAKITRFSQTQKDIPQRIKRLFEIYTTNPHKRHSYI